jgi:hypothetical protein
MSKQHAIKTIRHAASSAHAELAHRGLPAAARAVKVIGNATASIGSHVKGWHGEGASMMHGVLGHGHRKKRRKRPRTAAQKRATARMLAAARRRRHGHKAAPKRHRGKAHRKGGGTRHMSKAQKRAFKKMQAGARRARRGKKRKH